MRNRSHGRGAIVVPVWRYGAEIYSDKLTILASCRRAQRNRRVMLPKFPVRIRTTCRNFVLVCEETKDLGCWVQNVGVLGCKIVLFVGLEKEKVG
jgi:hypothetical protein